MVVSLDRWQGNFGPHNFNSSRCEDLKRLCDCHGRDADVAGETDILHHEDLERFFVSDMFFRVEERGDCGARNGMIAVCG
jgi:hypothetical protein